MSQNTAGRAPLPINSPTPLAPETPGVEAPRLDETLAAPSANGAYKPLATVGSRLQPIVHGARSFYGNYGKQWGMGWVMRELEQQLLTDAKVAQGLTILKNAVLGRTMRSAPNVAPSSPDWETALLYADFCNYNRRMMRGSWYGQVRQLLEGVLGHKIAAIETRVQESGQFKGKWVLDKIDVWPSNGYGSGYEFMQDESGRFCAVRVTGIDGKPRDIDLRKFLIFTNRPIDDNPHGTNILAALCEAYYKSVQANPELIALLTQYGRPGMYVIAPKIEAGVAVSSIPVFMRDGTPALNLNGTPMELSPLQYNGMAMAEYRAGTVVNLAGGSAIGLLQATPGGDSLFRFIKEDTDRDKIAVLLGTDKLTESNGTLSEGNAGSSEAVMGYGILDLRRNIEEMDEALMATLLELNYGAKALDLLPISDIGSMANPRIVGQLNAFGGLVNSGAVDVDQFYWYCVQNGLPIPNPKAPKVIVPQLAREAGGNPNNAAQQAA